MVKGMHTMFIAALACLGMPASAATPPCPPGDKPCVLKLMESHPTKTSSHWQGALARPLAERIGPAPPELVELLVLDVVANDFPNKPRAPKADPAFLADVRKALDG